MDPMCSIYQSCGESRLFPGHSKSLSSSCIVSSWWHQAKKGKSKIMCVVGAQILGGILLLRQGSHSRQPALPDAPDLWPEYVPQMSTLPELPEGSSCGPEDQTAELRKLLMQTQQKLKHSQVRA